MSSASTPRQAPSASMIRSSAKYSMKKRASCFSDCWYSVCRIAWPVRSAAAQVRCAAGPSPYLRGHAAERALVDLAVLGARERHAVVLELDHGRDRLAAHVLDRVLVAEPVGTLDGVVEVVAPVVLAHVAERGRDAALRRHGVRARREHLGDARRLQAFLRQPEGRAQAGAAGADDDHVVLVFGDLVGGGHRRLQEGVVRRGTRYGRSRTAMRVRRRRRPG